MKLGLIVIACIAVFGFAVVRYCVAWPKSQELRDRTQFEQYAIPWSEEALKSILVQVPDFPRSEGPAPTLTGTGYRELTSSSVRGDTQVTIAQSCGNAGKPRSWSVKIVAKRNDAFRPLFAQWLRAPKRTTDDQHWQGNFVRYSKPNGAYVIVIDHTTSGR